MKLSSLSPAERKALVDELWQDGFCPTREHLYLAAGLNADGSAKRGRLWPD